MKRIKKAWRQLQGWLPDIARKNHLDFFPIRKSLKGYNREKMRADLGAGLNVALLSFPQAMAYATIAGLPIEYGIYGSVIASILGPLFSGTRFVMLGPTNATSVLLFSSFLAIGATQEEKLAMIPLLLVMVGVFLILGALLRVANLIQYISRTVITGYITAAALYIIVNQARKVLGIEMEIPLGATLLGVIKLTLANILNAHLPSLLLSAATAALFIFLVRKFKSLPNVAITLTLMSLLTLGINLSLGAPDQTGNTYQTGLSMLNAIDIGNWTLRFPSLNGEWINKLASMALVIAFLCILEGSSIGKSLAARSGKQLDSNQSMLGMGIANIGCGLYGGMPASGSLTRSQLGWSSGSVTPLASVFSGLISALGACLLGPFFNHIPQAALGVLVIAIGVSLINRHAIHVVTKTTRSDAIVFVTTFLSALIIGLDFAIILGTATSILLFLHKAATPELVEYSFNEEGQLAQLEDAGKRPSPEVSIVHVEGDLFFGASELFRDQMRLVCAQPQLKVVILKMRNAHHLDASSVLALEELIEYMREKDRLLLVSEARKEVVRVFRNSGLMQVIGRENIFVDNPQNPTLSTAKALKRATSIIGDTHTNVRIYADSGKRKT